MKTIISVIIFSIFFSSCSLNQPEIVYKTKKSYTGKKDV